MSSKKVDQMVAKEGMIEELIENMNYVGTEIFPLIQSKLTEIKDTIDQALEDGEKMSNKTEEHIAKIWKHVNYLMALIMSTYDGNR